MKFINSNLSLISVLAIALLSTACSSSSVQKGAVKNYDTTIYESLKSPEQNLFNEIGGKPVIAAVMNDLVDEMSVDDRLAPFFRDAERNKFIKAMLTEQLCELAEGPCRYVGRSMENIHASMSITEGQFIALVEDAQIAMHKNDLSFQTQNKILALFAPMKKAIVAK